MVQTKGVEEEMNEECYLGFLREAGREVAMLWAEAGGINLDSDERRDLEDVLDNFFHDKERED